VQATREAVAIAAATLGRRTLEPEQLHALLSGKFVSAIRSVAAEMTMEQMHEQRGEYVTRLKAAAAEALAQNGLELESVAITDLDQTDLEYFNPSNRFDAEGLTRLMEDIEAKRKLRNDIEQDSMIKIRTRNLDAERQALEIERESETARLEQERDIEMRRALQRTEVARERALRETEAEQAQISARETIEKARIANEQAIAEARISSERETRHREIERTRAVEEKELLAREEIEKAKIANQRAVDTALGVPAGDDHGHDWSVVPGKALQQSSGCALLGAASERNRHVPMPALEVTFPGCAARLLQEFFARLTEMAKIRITRNDDLRCLG